MKVSNWSYKHIYIPLVDKRDRNHGNSGFTLSGHLWQFLVEAYASLFFKPSKKERMDNNGSNNHKLNEI